MKKETKTLREKHAEMASFAATTGVKVVKLEFQLKKAEARKIKLEAYTRRSNLTFYGVDEAQAEDTEKEVRKVWVKKS